MTEEAEERLKFDVYFTVNDYRVAVERWRDLRVSLLPNLNLLDRVPMANNFDPIVTQDYVEMIARIEASLVSASDIAVLDADTVPRNEPFGQEAFLIGLAITAVSIALLTGFLLLEKSGRFVSVELAARINSKTPV